jgi:subtilisin family serine protease
MKTFQRITVALIAVAAVVGLIFSFSRKVIQSPKSRAESGDMMDFGSHGKRPDGGHSVPASVAYAGAPLSPAVVAALMVPDARKSPHPVERAVAQGIVLDSRIEKAGDPNRWTRTRLVMTDVQPQVVRVVEAWEIRPDAREATCLSRDMYFANQLIVKASRGVDEEQLRQGLESEGMIVDRAIADRLFTVRLPTTNLDTVPKALQFLAEHPELAESAEADGVGFGGGVPNDSQFSDQWGMHNTGQSGGVADADVDAPEFWDIVGSTPGIVIAVLDSGLNFTHPDLQNIAWTNPGEISGDSIDNDANGKVDDVRGWDFVNNDNDPTDDHGHGSNVSGIIAANRDNGTGVAGLLSGARIVPCKILNSSNSGSTSNLIAATTYARRLGVPVMNLSLQNYPFSSSLNTEFTTCQTAGIVLCICAGNQGVNNDVTPNYPSCYTQSNIIAVGNHDRTDVRWSGAFNPSNYGATSVDLFAPGRDILSPVLGTSYSFYTGTSQSTPFVTAVCGAIKYANPSWTATEIKNGVLSSVVTVSAYSGICTTGGRLNAVNAVAHAFRQLPLQDSDGDGFSNLFEYLVGSRIDSLTSRPAPFTDNNGGYLRVGVPRVLRPDAHLQVEMSPDLSSWTAVGVTDFSTSGTALGGISLSGGTQGFLRIRAVPSP